MKAPTISAEIGNRRHQQHNVRTARVDIAEIDNEARRHANLGARSAATLHQWPIVASQNRLVNRPAFARASNRER